MAVDSYRMRFGALLLCLCHVFRVLTNFLVCGFSQWCGLTVKQGTTAIHEDSATYTVPISSLTMEVEVDTHALYWIALGSSHTCSLLDCFGKQSHMLSTGLLWEAVTHVLYWIALGSDSRTTHAILLTVVSGVSRIDLRVSLFARTLSERGLEDHWNSSRVYFHIFPFNYSKMGIGHMGTRPNTRLQNQWACNKK